MLFTHKSFNGCAIERSASSYCICLIAYDIAMLCTICWPMRVTAERRSVTGLPMALNAAELAVCSSRAANRGSAPTMVTTCSEVVSGSMRASLMRTTTLEKQGRSTVPRETSVANSCRNVSAAARCSGVELPSAGTDAAPDRYVGVVSVLDIRHAHLANLDQATHIDAK